MTFSFIQITDHHLGESEQAYNLGYATAWALRRVMDHMADHAAHGADFLVCTGDLVNLGSDAEYAFARRFLGLAGAAVQPGPLALSWPGLEGLPIYFLPGNHDPRAAFCRNLFPDTVPRDHLDTIFHHKGVQFICLDTGTAGRAAEIRPETLDFLRQHLDAVRPSIILMHHHPVPVGIPWLDRALPAGMAEFWDAVGAGRVLGVLFGHTHATVAAEVRGTPVLGLRSTNFQFWPAEEPVCCMLPPHYRLVTVTCGRLVTKTFEVPL